MKKSIILTTLFLSMVVYVGFSADQSGVKETRDVKGFTKVGFGVSGNLYINFGPEFKVVLEGEKSDLEDIITEVSGEKLVIKKENWRHNMNEKITVYITMPGLAGLAVSGSGKAEISDAVKSTDLSFDVSGSGKIFASDVMVTNLDCEISGSGDIIMKGNGTSTKTDISISGSGSYTGEQLKSESADVRISGSGSCICNVKESLTAHISGSGNVSYLGNPRIDARVSGSGHVRSK
jgi:hypothetical protein